VFPRHEQLIELSGRIASIHETQPGAGEDNVANMFATFNRELTASGLLIIATGILVAGLSIRRIAVRYGQIVSKPTPPAPSSAPLKQEVEAAQPPAPAKTVAPAPLEKGQDTTALMAQNKPMPPAAIEAPAPESKPKALPKTAGNFALLPLFGLSLLVGGSTLLGLTRRRA